MAVYVLDTSAVLATFNAEPGYEEVRGVLRNARESDEVEVYLPFMALMEVEYQFLRDMDRAGADLWLNVALGWPVTVVESTEAWRHRAAEVKSRGRISLGDSWMAALALINDATLIHKDPEFDGVDGLKMLKLPYDKDALGKGQ